MESAGGLFAAFVLLSLFLLVWVGLFILLRKFVLWYWRVDEIVGLLKDIRGELRVFRSDVGDITERLR